jgi:diketogulonate reductase-like aldo/keto reductase
MPLSRRNLLKIGLGAGASLFLDHLSAPLLAQRRRELLRKPVPSTGELLPVVGLGSWITFNLGRESSDWAPAREVIRTFHALGGKVIDTAPSYQRSEAFVGQAIGDFGIADGLFLATKVNVADAGPAAANAQMEQSSRVLGKPTIDLMQVWNLGDSSPDLSDRHLAAHLESISAYKEAGRARYIGITTSFNNQYPAIERTMRSFPLDFVQVDFSIGDRSPEEPLLPLARERGMAVIVNRPFTTGNLFTKVAGVKLPPWTSEFDCDSWAQFFLKYIVSHPAVTCAIPATNDPVHLRDNMGACFGRLPDDAMRKRMVEFFLKL